MLPEELQTERLHLRVPRAEDAQVVFDTWARDPHVTRYLTWSPHASIDDTRAFITACSSNWRERRGHRPWLIERREDGRAIGMIGLTLEGRASVGPAPTAHRASVGYGLGRAFWGRGFMTEALREVIRAALALPPLHRVYAVCDVENVASARVMEKAGMRFEGTLRRWIVHPNVSREPRDCHIYAVVR